MKKLQKTVFGIVLVLMAGMCPAVWAQDAEDTQGAEKEGTQWKNTPCSQWNDTALRVAFPRKIGDLTMCWRSVPPDGEDGIYRLEYNLPPGSQGEWMPSFLHIVVDSTIDTGDDEIVPNGVGPQVRRWFDSIMPVIRERDTNVTDIAEGEFPHGGQKYLWASYSTLYRDDNGDITPSRRDDNGGVLPFQVITLVTAFNRRIVRLRYAVLCAEHLETSDTFKAVLDTVGRMFKEVEASAVDVYAIADPKAALAAVRRKWPGAADRISMWEMPKHAKTFFEIDSLQNWCNDDPPKRYHHFEQASKRAVDLRIEPPIWYYNLACARAVQGRTVAAFEALEQATAAGFGVGTSFGDDISKDVDFASITNDSRFAKLCAMMRADERQSWKMPRTYATEENGVLNLTDDNVYWGFKNESFWVRLKTTNECPIVYVNRHADHPQTPCNGLISVRYPQEAIEARCNEGPANIYVTGGIR